MKRLSAPGHAHWSAGRAFVWLVLVALLFVQTRVAIGACLLMDSRPATSAELTLQGEYQFDPCGDSGSSRACLTVCERSSESPKPSSDLPQFLPAVLSIAPAFTALANLDGDVLRDSPGSDPGPALYLRFHRYLN